MLRKQRHGGYHGRLVIGADVFFATKGYVMSSLKVGCQPSKLDVNLQSWMFTFEVGCQPARAESVDGLPQPSES